MNVEEQMQILKNIYKEKTEAISENEFRFKFVIMLNIPNKYKEYQKRMEIIDLLSSLIENSFLQGNTRRIFRYLCVYINYVDELVRDVNQDMERRLHAIEGHTQKQLVIV